MTTILPPARDVRVPTATLATTVTVAALGPLAVAAARALLPYDTVDEHATIVAQVAAHPTAGGAVLWLAYLIVLTLPLSVLVAGRAAMRARPVLGGVAAVVAWVGFASLAYVVGSDQVIQATIDAGLAPAQAAAVSAAVEVPPVAGVATAVFVIGHIAGAVLLGVALWGAIPRWAAVALIVSQPLHLVFAVLVPNHALDALAWVLTAVGFVAAAFVPSRTA